MNLGLSQNRSTIIFSDKMISLSLFTARLIDFVCLYVIYDVLVLSERLITENYSSGTGRLVSGYTFLTQMVFHRLCFQI